MTLFYVCVCGFLCSTPLIILELMPVDTINEMIQAFRKDIYSPPVFLITLNSLLCAIIFCSRMSGARCCCFGRGRVAPAETDNQDDEADNQDGDADNQL